MKYRIITVGTGSNTMKITDPVRTIEDCETDEELITFLRSVMVKRD